MYTRKFKESVADTILKQLGGNKFLAMTGAKNLAKGVDDKKREYLGFRLPRTYNNINYVKVIYDHGRDTYTMEFGKIAGVNYKVIWSGDDLYFDDLQRIFTMKTGLDTHL